MRKRINRIISQCSTCVMNNVPIGTAEKTGGMIDMQINNTFVVDFAGPINGFSQIGGKPRYVYLAVDMLSSYTNTRYQRRAATMKFSRGYCIPDAIYADFSPGYSQTMRFSPQNPAP